MTEQLDLLAWAPPPAVRTSDPETSVLAALRNPKGRHIDRRRVLEAHAEHPGGLTDFELAEIVGRQQTSAGKRRGELRDIGLIGETVTKRPAPSGSPAIVWKITNEGLRVVREMGCHPPGDTSGDTPGPGDTPVSHETARAL